MKRLSTILCSVAFMISGIMMAISATDKSSSTGYKTIAAATLPNYTLPTVPVGNVMNLSDDLVRDIAKQKGVLDTVYVTKTDTIYKQVTKVKWRKAPAPPSVMEINVTAAPNRDTVTVYYLATQVGNKEDPNGCIPIYEIKKVNELCPEIVNSSVNPPMRLENDAGE